MALTVPETTAPRALSSFEGDAEARTDEVMTAWANDLCHPQDLPIRKACATFLEAGLTRVFLVFKRLTEDEAADAFWNPTHEKRKPGQGVGWVTTMEGICGFRFRAEKAPPSAALVDAGNTKSTKDKKIKKTEPTVSKRLMDNGTFGDERLPRSVYDCIKSVNLFFPEDDEEPDPKDITNRELNLFTDAILQHCASKHASWKLGAPLCRAYAAQALRVISCPPYGLRSAARRNAVLWYVIETKCNNRFYVRACPRPRRPCCSARSY